MRIRFKFPDQVPFSTRAKEAVLFMEILMAAAKRQEITSVTVDLESNTDPRVLEVQVWNVPGGDATIQAAKSNLKTALGTEHELRIKNRTTGMIVECKRCEPVTA